VPWWASEPRKPNPAGALMCQAENVTAIDPATCRLVLPRRAETWTVTWCVVPFMVSWSATVRLAVPPSANAGLGVTGAATFADYESGYDPADPVDRAIMAIRKAVFPHHGLMP
jgi:hypothetical protein